MNGKKGILFGVSVGPGDPELMTVKAVRTLEQCDVIAAPQTRDGAHIALDIANGAADLEEKEIRFLSFTMSRDPEVLEKSHREAAGELMELLDAGKTVAMLNLGDADVYGTWEYIRAIVEASGYETVTIPGVTSFCAAAAALGVSLTSGAEPLTILPASHPDVTKDLLRNPGTKVLMKSGKSLGKMREMLEAAGLAECAMLGVNVGLPGEKLYRDIREADADEGYFATILVPGDKEFKGRT